MRGGYGIARLSHGEGWKSEAVAMEQQRGREAFLTIKVPSSSKVNGNY